MKQLLTLSVNGETHEVWVSVHKTLLEVLREDNRAIVRAASQASKAADWLLAFLPADDQAAPSSDRRAA